MIYIIIISILNFVILNTKIDDGMGDIETTLLLWGQWSISIVQEVECKCGIV